MKYVLAVLFVVAGANHFLNPAIYVSIMPGYLPAHLFLVYVSGAFEILFGAMLLVPRWKRAAGWGLILLLIAVFPANLHMTMHPELYPDIRPVFLWVRLPLQGLLIAWVYWTTLRTPASADQQ